MKFTRVISAGLFAFVLSTTNFAGAQTLKTPAPSPLQTIDQAFGLSNIKIEYSRPSVKGRTVFGDLVPFGKIWRTGANNATKITFGEDVSVEGTPVKAGTYAVYTIPNKDSWEVMFYKDLTLGGNTTEYKTENEILHVKIKTTPASSKVETFTITVNDMASTTANVEFAWENTKAAFKVTTDIDATVMKNIDESLAKDSRPYFSAANYYYENNKDLKKALEWTDLAIQQNPKAFYMVHLKAKIQMKMKDYKGAIETANKSMALSKEAKSDDYVKLNEKLITEANAGK